MKDLLYVKNDGGKSSASRPDKADCTVRSLAIFLGLSYDESFQILKKAGRQDGKGFDINSFICGFEHEKYEFWLEDFSRENCTVERFIRENPKGEFMVSLAEHVFNIIDGKIHDIEWKDSYPESLVMERWKKVEKNDE